MDRQIFSHINTTWASKLRDSNTTFLLHILRVIQSRNQILSQMKTKVLLRKPKFANLDEWENKMEEPKTLGALDGNQTTQTDQVSTIT